MIAKFGSALACGISVVLSVQVLSSLGTGFMMYIFGATAIVIEIAKYVSFIEAQKRFQFYAVTFLLTVISIGASIGSLNNGLQKDMNAIQKYEQQVSALEQTRQKFIQMEYLTKSLKVQAQIDALEKPELTSSLGLVSTLSQVSGVNVVTVSNWIFITMAVVIDLCAFMLLMVIGKPEEVERVEIMEVKEVKQEPKPNTTITTKSVEVKETVIQQELFIDDVLFDALVGGDCKASVRAVMKFKGVGYQKASNALEGLVAANKLTKSDTGRYQLV